MLGVLGYGFRGEGFRGFYRKRALYAVGTARRVGIPTHQMITHSIESFD